MALFFELFSDAGIIDSIEDKVDMLCHASTSIVSSIDPQHSAQLALQLLTPSALLDASTEIVGAVSSVLDLNGLGDIALVDRIIALCRPLVQRHAADVLDGCCSLMLSRYRILNGNEQVADAVLWLRKGVELESLVLPAEVRTIGTCYRTLAAICYAAVHEIAEEFLTRNEFMIEEATSRALCRTEAILEGLRQGADADVSSTVPAVRTLRSVYKCCRSADSVQVRADELIECFRRVKRDDDCIQRTVVPPCFHWTFLLMARKFILKAEEISYFEEGYRVSVFDAAGVALLMGALNDLAVLNRAKLRNRRYDESEVKDMTLVMCLALERAYVAEHLNKIGPVRPVIPGRKATGYLAFVSHPNDTKLTTVSRILDG
jgi:hypothetical protein